MVGVQAVMITKCRSCDDAVARTRCIRHRTAAERGSRPACVHPVAGRPVTAHHASIRPCTCQPCDHPVTGDARPSPKTDPRRKRTRKEHDEHQHAAMFSSEMNVLNVRCLLYSLIFRGFRDDVTSHSPSHTHHLNLTIHKIMATVPNTHAKKRAKVVCPTYHETRQGGKSADCKAQRVPART